LQRHLLTDDVAQARTKASTGNWVRKQQCDHKPREHSDIGRLATGKRVSENLLQGIAMLVDIEKHKAAPLEMASEYRARVIAQSTAPISRKSDRRAVTIVVHRQPVNMRISVESLNYAYVAIRRRTGREIT
jgi:hypothetical protein